MQFTKALCIIVSFSIGILLGLVFPAMSRDEVPGQRSEISEGLVSVNPTSRDNALEGMIILYGTNENSNTSVPAPPLQKLSRSDSYFGTEGPQFRVTYTGFTDEAREAFQYAVDIWNSLIRSPVPIWIDATFTDFGGYEDGGIVLGGAQPVAWKPSRALNLWFVDALADHRAGRDLADGKPDIITRFNRHAEVNWYFGTDGNTPWDKMDFVSTVIHEIAHGLGFFSAAREEKIPTMTSSSGERGKLRSGKPKALPHIYDFFVVNGSGTAIMQFDDPSTSLLEQFTSNNLFWSGAKGVAANGDTYPQLHAPSTWDAGSGYAHLDEVLFPAGDINSLMTPHLDKQEAIHDPGPIALGMLEDMGWSINKAPVFTEGSVTTRTVVEKTAADVSIGNPVVATDANNERLTYQLSGIDATSFDIDSTSAQLKTKAALHHETKASYTVTVTVSDGSLIDKITVIIIVVDIIVEVPTNEAPEFIDGGHTTRSVPENTPRGVNIREPIAATDADDDSLIYTLSGPDMASFDIDPITGQLRTFAALDYETKHTYTVKITVSDGRDTDTITVDINVTDVDDQKSPAITLTSRSPLTEATLNESIVTLTLRNRIYENWLNDPVMIAGIAGVTANPANVKRVNATTLTVGLTFDGTDLDTDATLTFTVQADAIANYDGPALTATVSVTAITESVNASSAVPLTEATLNGGMITLTLSGRSYEAQHTVGNNVTVSGITGVTVSRFDVERISDTQVNLKLIFDGTDFDTNARLTFKVGSDAVTGYNGAALVAQLPVIAVVERRPIITAFAPRPLTETTLNGGVVTLTLSSGVYARSISDIRRAVKVSGIRGVTFRQSDVIRLSDTQVTVKLAFDNTNFDTDATLTFRIGAGAIVGYNGPALIAEIRVTAAVEERPTITLLTPQPFTEATLDGSVILLTLKNGTYVQSRADIENAVTVSGIAGVSVKRSGVERLSDTEVTVELEFDGNFDRSTTLTFTMGADAVAEYEGPLLIAQGLVLGGQESIVVSTSVPLTELTLNRSVVTLALKGAIYEQSAFDFRGAVAVSGVEGVTFHWFDLDRVSDTELTVELTFDGNLDADATLTFAVGADAIAGYDGPPLTAQVVVTGGKESIVATTEVPLTEATLNGSVVTLTLSGRTFERSIFAIRDTVTVSGIDGVTIPWHQPNRESDTQLTITLEFDGDFDTDKVLMFTVGADALLGYNGPAFTLKVPVSGGEESVTAMTKTPLTEATLNGSIVTLTLKGAKYADSIFDIRDAVTASGIAGVTIPWHQPVRKNDTELTIALEFDGDFDTDRVLTFTVGAGAIANYNGPALTAQITVTADREDALLINFPNPFNPETWIPYQLSKPAEVTITIYAIDGQVVRTLTLGHQPAGMYQNRSRAAYWDGRNAFGEPVASGVYFYTLTAENFTATRKMLIRK
ncbi:hypothetical protein C6500_02865 [Candidatus Poribacteria bacterium]|nr:MAG: hypothetical protein C6500_02865 [Candidatus Poribacteria bacterium]